jgi:hypothetical protein
MRTTLLVCFVAFLGSASSLQAAEPFVGTWKLNVAKSKLTPTPPGMAANEETLVIQKTGEGYEITMKGTRENNSPFVVRYSVPQKGGPLTFAEGAPPTGTSMASKRINDRTVDLITTRDGKAVSTNHVTVSANGKTMRGDEKGVDAQGKPIQGFAVWDKQ